MHFVQSKQSTRLQIRLRAWYKQFTETGCLRKQKSSGRSLTAEDDFERVRASFVTCGAHTENLQLSKNLSIFLWL